ncbi:hypothetical protein Rsub_13313 [Raphidocelis subcapitata]|uniref:RAP domain-containing protein n=1 Tax=Raphidocelis subcapitata TaxID=307507 RepID=A0A2V0PSG0_9CHLO|nr:hypothetical protein Rsub_13313 [Raphidocelis subcapitata]|eukprot:GBG00548.1 hypothetical protein Rsub_13313 [Raphidocelis subcapitata]
MIAVQAPPRGLDRAAPHHLLASWRHRLRLCCRGGGGGGGGGGGAAAGTRAAAARTGAGAAAGTRAAAIAAPPPPWGSAARRSGAAALPRLRAGLGAAQAAGDEGEDDAAAAAARLLLRRLSLYVPRGPRDSVFGDGLAALARAQPYRRAEFEAALRDGRSELASLSLRQLAGIASALAAARHVDAPFMAALGDAAVAVLRASWPGAEWGPVCHLALAYARLGLLHEPLMAALAAAATLLLDEGAVKLGTWRRASQVAGLVAAYAALRLRPARLLAAVAEAAKQVEAPSLLGHLDAWESVVMVWAVGRLEGRNAGSGSRDQGGSGRSGGGATGSGTGSNDSSAALALSSPAYSTGSPTALQQSAEAAQALEQRRGRDAALWKLLLDRATTRVGQLPRHDLCRAYCLLAEAGADDPELLAALRRALRERINLLKPPQLAAAVCGLAGLGHRDALLMDELARWLYNKRLNFSPGELVSSLVALAVIGYRNPWLLRAWSWALSNRKRGALAALTGGQLSAVVAALAELGWPHTRLLDAAAGEAAERILRTANPTSAAVRDSAWALAPGDIAAIACGLAGLRHRHEALLTQACNAAVAAAREGDGGWCAADFAAVAWAAAVFGGGDAAVLEAAAAAAAAECGASVQEPGRAALTLVRLAWACAAHELSGGAGDGGRGGAHALAEVVPLLEQRVAPLLRGKDGAAWLRRLGPEALQLAQHLRAPREPAVPLLPPALEAAAVASAGAAAREGERGATLSAVAAAVVAQLEAAGRGGAGSTGTPPPRVLVGHPLPGTLLVADVAVLRAERPPAAVLFTDAGAFAGDGHALAPASVAQAQFERAGWRVAWLRAEQWAEADGQGRRRLVSAALASVARAAEPVGQLSL